MQQPSAIKIGNGTYGTIDLLKAIANMTTAEKICFFSIRNGIKLDKSFTFYVYQVAIRTSEFTETNKSQFTKGFKLLSAKDLVRRISRGIYMINPTALIPTDFEREFAIWNNTHLQPVSEDNQ